MPVVNVRLSDQAHQLLTLRCKSEGESVCGASRKIIERDLQKDFKLPTAKVKCPRREEQKHQVALLLTTSEIEAIDRLKNHIGGSRNGWIVEAVRTRLTDQPSFTDTETKVLNENTYEVRKFTRALREWATKIGASGMQADGAVMAKVQASVDSMTVMATKNCKAVDRLVCASRDRWSIK